MAKVFSVVRDCCEDSNCFACIRKPKSQRPVRIEQWRGADAKRAKIAAKNWARWNATIEEKEV